MENMKRDCALVFLFLFSEALLAISNNDFLKSLQAA
jgi:hypothetical protein